MKRALIVIGLVVIVSMVVGGIMAVKAVVAQYNDIKRRVEHPDPHMLDEVAAPVKKVMEGMAAGAKEMGNQVLEGTDPKRDKENGNK